MSTLYSVLFFIKAVSVLLFKEEMKIKYFCANYNCSSQLPWAALYFSLSRVLAVSNLLRYLLAFTRFSAS